MKHKWEEKAITFLLEPLLCDGNLSVSGRLGLRLTFHGGF